MREDEAKNLVDKTFSHPYDDTRFRNFISNLFAGEAGYEQQTKNFSGQYMPDSFKDHIDSYKRLAKFNSPKNETIDVLAVKLKTQHKLENARTMQRNFIARYLNGGRGGQLKDAALVAFYADDTKNWRFSLIRMDYELNEKKDKIQKTFTPAYRHSFLVGADEKTHTA
ncbi:MAG: Eco57I restriction-modification methylase domain-containing protein, partial [Alphaproteobacteria bacterium]